MKDYGLGSKVYADKGTGPFIGTIVYVENDKGNIYFLIECNKENDESFTLEEVLSSNADRWYKYRKERTVLGDIDTALKPQYWYVWVSPNIDEFSIYNSTVMETE